MDRTWTVEIGSKKYLVEADYGMCVADGGTVLAQRDGKLSVDGNSVSTWKAGLLPKEISFKLEGKPAAVRKKGFFNPAMELFLEGKLIKPAK